MELNYDQIVVKNPMDKAALDRALFSTQGRDPSARLAELCFALVSIIVTRTCGADNLRDLEGNASVVYGKLERAIRNTLRHDMGTSSCDELNITNQVIELMDEIGVPSMVIHSYPSLANVPPFLTMHYLMACNIISLVFPSDRIIVIEQPSNPVN